MVLPKIRFESHLMLNKELLGISYARRSLRDMCKFYIEVLDGNTDVRLPRKDLLGGLITMEDMISSHVIKSLEQEIYNPDWIYAGINQMYCKSGWQLVVVINVNSICVMYAGFLEELKTEDKSLYLLAKRTLNCLVHCCLSPVKTLSMLVEEYDSYGFLADIGEENPEMIRETFREFRIFNRYMGKRNKTCKRYVNALKKEYIALRRKLSREQKRWIEDVFELLQMSTELDGLKFVDYEGFDNFYNFDESCDVTDFFGLLWEEGSAFDQYWYDGMHYKAQNFMEPFIPVRVETREDFKKVRKFVRYLSLLQKIMVEGDRIWRN
jgi:hypothetical protein